MAEVANISCNCQNPEVFLCFDCSQRHIAKNPNIKHQIIDWQAKLGAVQLGTAELRRNLVRVQQFSTEFEDMIQNCINHLI